MRWRNRARSKASSPERFGAMIRLILLALTIAIAAISGALAETDCDSGRSCNIAAKAALKNGDLPGAQDAFRHQVDFATGEHNTKGGADLLICDGLKNLARLSLQLGKPLRGHAWADVAETI